MSTDTIGSGKDHTTHADWFAAIPSTLTEKEVGLQTGTFTISSDLTFSGKTTTAALNIVLRPDTGQSFVDSKDDVGFKLQYDESQGTAITSTTNYAEVHHDQAWMETHQIQFFGATNAYTDFAIAIGADNVLVQDCIGKFEGYVGFWAGEVDGDSKMVNCLVQDSDEFGHGDEGIRLLNGGQAINCTAVRLNAGGDIGVRETTGDTNVVKNTAIFGFATATSGTFASGSDYNATDNGSVEGANSLDSLTTSDQFEDVSSRANFDGRLKSGSDLIGAGLTDSDFPNDIFGQPRHPTNCDIGCHELTPFSAGSIPNKVVNINRAVQRASNW